MKDIGTRSIEPTKQQYLALVTETKKVVTDQQIAKYRQLRGQ